MKRFLSCILVALLSLQLFACSSEKLPAGEEKGEKPTGATEYSYTIGGVELVPQVYGGPTLSFEYNVDLHFKFALRTEHVSAMIQKDPLFKVEGRYSEGGTVDYDSGTAFEIGEPQDVEIVGVAYKVYDVVVMGIERDSFHKEYSANAYLCFKDGGTNYRIGVGEAVSSSVFFAALGEYNDRSSIPGDGYNNRRPDGTYTKLIDVTPYESVLNSVIVLETEGAMTLRDLSETKYFSSAYSIEYFDGILEIGMKNGAPITNAVLSMLIINGEDTYYEIQDGKILLAIPGALDGAEAS